MRLFWALLSAAAVGCGPGLFLGTAAADTIVLKNGRRIVAAMVVEEAQRVIYETPEGRFTLPRSLVARVDRDGALPKVFARGSEPQRDTPLPALPGRDLRPERVIADGKVDRGYLEDLARQPAGRPYVAAAFLTAVEHEINQGRLDAALELARRGADAVPGEPQMLVAQAVVMMQKQEFRQAREILLRALALAPNSAQILKYLGYSEYLSDRLDDAIRSWKKSLSLAPDPDVQSLLEKAERENATEERYQEAASSHFTLRFEGGQVSPAFRRELLDTLEAHFRDLERDLEVSQRESLTVILYTNQAFRDVTQVPDWVSALFDGKMRIPVEGLTSMTPELRAVLKHEMTHSFVQFRSRGRAPVWLQEGLAQSEEGKSSARFAPLLLEMWKTNGNWGLLGLEEPFHRLKPGAVRLAYQISLAAVEMLRDRYGIEDLGRVLDRLSAGDTPEAALRSVLRLSYSDLERELAEYLERKTR